MTDMQHTPRKQKRLILICLLLGVLFASLTCSNFHYWKRLHFIFKGYRNDAYHVSLLLSDPTSIHFPQKLQNTLVPIICQPKTHGVKVLQVIYCTEKENLYCAVRYPVNLNPVFRLNVDGEHLCAGNIIESPGFPYVLLEFTFDLSQVPEIATANAALELYRYGTDEEGLVLLETLTQ